MGWKMIELCEHTLLLNAILGLVQKHNTYPCILAEKGYQLECICPSFLNHKGKEINPDIILKSHSENNLLLGDCKTGTMQKEQALCYKDITIEEIKEQNITSLSGNITIDKTSICLERNLPKILEKDKEWEVGLNIICKFDSGLLKKADSIKFHSSILEDLFSRGVQLPQFTPTVYYQFSPEDPEEYILMHILPAILYLSLNLNKTFFTLEELLLQTHSLYAYLDEKEKTKLKSRVNNILSNLERTDLKESINRIPNQPNSWEVIKNRVLSFRNKCQTLIKEYQTFLQKENEAKKQKKIFDSYPKEK